MREAAEGAGTSARIRDATGCGALLGRGAAYYATGRLPSTWIQERVSRWADLCPLLHEKCYVVEKDFALGFHNGIMREMHRKDFQLNFRLIYIMRWFGCFGRGFHNGIKSYKCILDIVIGRKKKVNWFLNLVLWRMIWDEILIEIKNCRYLTKSLNNTSKFPW